MAYRATLRALTAVTLMMAHLRCAVAMAPADKATVREALAGTRVAMCRAVVREMHIEIHKHSLRKNGEDDIYETVPAICMAIVQNYTLIATPPPHRSWTLSKRATKLDDAYDEAPPDPSTMQYLMVLKESCMSFTDDLQQELSELMYRAALEADVEPIVEAFCSKPEVTSTPPPPPPRRRDTSGKRKKSKGTSKGASKGAPPVPNPDQPGEMPDMEKLLKKYDTDGTIANLMEMERETPEAMLEPEQLQQVQDGSIDVRCDVCKAASKAAVGRARKLKALRDEERISEIVSNVCYGTPPGSLEEYPKYPGNPPLWGEMYTVDQHSHNGGGDGGERLVWRMRRLPKGATAEEKGGKEYMDLVMKHSIISRACKSVVLNPEEEDDDLVDLAQTIYEHSAESAAQIASRYCGRYCDRSDSQKDEL